MEYGAVIELLKEAIGLDAASISTAAITRAVRTRMGACGIAEARRYAALLRASPPELQELIESVVVPETWFFRDREAFALLAGFGLRQWRKSPHRMIRILSVPCATGEEPYSIAMALLDAGIPPTHFRIDAVDISLRSLEKALAGVYRKNSFRGTALDFRERYFDRVGEAYRLRPEARGPVMFCRGNLLQRETLPEAPAYDMIFCRNVLIYFEPAAQQAAIDTLERLLSDTGTLFVAAAETTLLSARGFSAVKAPLAFAFRKAARPLQTAAATAARESLPPPLVIGTSPPPAAAAMPAPQRQTGPVAQAGIESAMLLADRGCLAEAAGIAEEHLKRQELSAPAFYLLGLVRDAAGDFSAAARYYRQALYLDPAHRDAMAHLALLLDRQGEPQAASLMRARLKRVVSP
jgi:chemotaxis protein methyltransferase WspC